MKKFVEINRNQNKTKKFILVIEAVKLNVANTHQFNKEDSTPDGDVYAIKVDEHRFYTLVTKDNFGYRELFICRYGKKQSQQNDKKLTTTIESISKISIQKVLQ